MILCAQCGQPTDDRGGLCSYHSDSGDSWASGNRVMCDFLHRGIVASTPREHAHCSVGYLVEGLDAA
jgi:hypothetical protein